MVNASFTKIPWTGFAEVSSWNFLRFNQNHVDQNDKNFGLDLENVAQNIYKSRVIFANNSTNTNLANLGILLNNLSSIYDRACRWKR